MKTSDYLNQQRLTYAIYVLNSRALPSASDGLKAAARRVLWIAKDGKKQKSAALAGNTMCIHPHDAPTDAINTITAPFGCNIPLLSGDGAFGTVLEPKSYGASRYTSVKISEFTKDVIFRDIEIIPMQPCYDDSELEPVTFLPLVPIALLNPTEGIAVGFACNILPRKLDDLILAQLAHLKGAKSISNPIPTFTPTNSVAISTGVENKYVFAGSVDKINSSSCRITSLPFGISHSQYVEKLIALAETAAEGIVDFDDDSSKKVDIVVYFNRGSIKDCTEDDLIKKLNLFVRHTENLTLVNFDYKSVVVPTVPDLIRTFTDWRLKFYLTRFERLRDLLQLDLQRYYDIRTAITKHANKKADSMKNKSEFKEWLTTINIVNLDYIAEMATYRYTAEEFEKNEKRIAEAEAQLQQYNELISDPEKRKKVYIAELKDVLSKYLKGFYN